ncbi:hypothetical protein SteCoe_27577 [Stentor coeruleus]|uniref:Uncharacterized protein n=1 Tax=Stentor coeruleus TaxID=5963 RepID=A0A1R2BA49_9CILI|nr:hypothetical protein SteCoe_27577 [Stentor coeruleus]
MGKNSDKDKKMHHKKKDRKHKRERSKKEHLLRKSREQEQEKSLQEEQSKYIIDDSSYRKLIKILRDLLSYNPETEEAILEVFSLLDSSQELEITDIEDGFIRESLEKIFTIFTKQLNITEDNDGRYVYTKNSGKSLKEQISSYVQKAKTAPNVDHVSELLTGCLEKDMEIKVKPQAKPLPTVTAAQDKTIRQEISAHDSEFRQKTLMEIHMEKHKSHLKNQDYSKYIYTGKTLDKRFGQGKFFK